MSSRSSNDWANTDLTAVGMNSATFQAGTITLTTGIEVIRASAKPLARPLLRILPLPYTIHPFS
jgi:hypothetical protein